MRRPEQRIVFGSSGLTGARAIGHAVEGGAIELEVVLRRVTAGRTAQAQRGKKNRATFNLVQVHKQISMSRSVNMNFGHDPLSPHPNITQIPASTTAIPVTAPSWNALLFQTLNSDADLARQV